MRIRLNPLLRSKSTIDIPDKIIEENYEEQSNMKQSKSGIMTKKRKNTRPKCICALYRCRILHIHPTELHIYISQYISHFSNLRCEHVVCYA